jgi:serine/threonine protein kinase
MLTTDKQDPASEFAHTYVLKTYRFKDAKDNYETEVKAFRALMPGGGLGKSIIGFYGSYEQDGSYNVLLEYADRGTLEDYLQNTPPPTTGLHIYKFWEALFNVIKGLKLIHSVQGDEADGPPILQGYICLVPAAMHNANRSLQMASRCEPIQYSRHKWQKRIEIRL